MAQEATKTAVVVGASRGLGRGIALSLAEAGAPVVGVARTWTDPMPTDVRTEAADATDATVASDVLKRYDPELVVLVAGAGPALGALHEQTWEGFSTNWNADVKIAFHWLGEVLRAPLRPGSRVIVFSSGAALAGSPLSGGYAGAKATQRFLTGYAQDEADRARLDLTFTAVLPTLTPFTELGSFAVTAYANRSGISEQDFVAQLGNPLTPESAGAAVVELSRSSEVSAAYLLTGDGLKPLP